MIYSPPFTLPPTPICFMAKKTGNAITHETIIRDIQGGKIAPVYYLMGEESYYIDRLATFIADSVLKPEEKDFNLCTLYGPDTSMHDVVQAALSYPMGAERQVVVVKEAQKLTSLEPLSDYLKHPLLSTVLIFCHKNGSIDQRKAGVVKLLEKTGVVYESNRLKDYQLPAWIRSYVHRKRADIEPMAENILADHVGTDLNRMAGEIDKLLLSLQDGESKITSRHVAAHIGISKEYNVYELTDALVRKDVEKAMKIASYFEKTSKQNPIQKTLPVLFKFFQNLMLSYYAPDPSPSGIAAWVGTSQWAVEKNILPAMRMYTGRKVMEIIGQIRRTDARSKGVDNPATGEGELMKELLFFILH